MKKSQPKVNVIGRNKTYFLKQSAIRRIENPNERAPGAGGGEELPAKRESEAHYTRTMRQNEIGLLLRKVLHTHLTHVQAQARQHHRTTVLRNRAESLGVRNGLNLVQKLEVREIVHQYLHLQRHDDPVLPETHAANGVSEAQLAEAPSLVIVPEKDLVGRELRVGPSPDDGEYV